jgi:hypothetical protein
MMMSIVRFARHVLLLVPLAATFVACGSSEAPIPEMPTFAADVQPILDKHCVRCHGANGTLNDALNPDGTPSGLGAPTLCYLSRYADEGDCTPDGVLAGNCRRGAQYCAVRMGDPPASFIEAYVLILTQEAGGMPPLPLPPLSAREKEIVRRWLENGYPEN